MNISLFENKKSKHGVCLKSWTYNWASNKFLVYSYNSGRSDWYYDELPGKKIADILVANNKVVFTDLMFDKLSEEDKNKYLEILPHLRGYKRLMKL